MTVGTDKNDSGKLLMKGVKKMKKFILGYVIGSVISSIATDYLVRSEIYIRYLERKNNA